MGLEVSAEALFLYRKPAENCRRSGGPGHRQQYSWTGYRCTGRRFSNSATDHGQRVYDPRQTVYPYTRERHSNGQRGRQKTGAALRVRVFPRGTGSAAQPIDRRCKATGRQCERYSPRPALSYTGSRQTGEASVILYIARPAVSQITGTMPNPGQLPARRGKY